MEKKLGIIGGDLRIALLAELFIQDGWEVMTYGLENYEGKLPKAELKEVEKNQKIVSAVPLSKDGKQINAPFAKKPIFLTDFMEEIKEGTLIAGKIEKEWKEQYPNKKMIDLLEDETLTIQNAITTAEGAIQIIMEKTKTTLYGSNILILGFGRIGKILANRLEKFGANLWCEARKESDLIWIEAYGYQAISLKELSNLDWNSFSIIINTIPYPILGEEEITKLNPNCYVIDLASAPGGVDREKIEKHRILFDWALALPGKVAPLTSAQFLKQAIERIEE